MEGRTIRICSALAALIALALVTPATASPVEPASDYLRARLAAASGDAARAARGYAEAIALRPDDIGLALRAYQTALVADDEALLLRATRRLEVMGALPPEGELVLLVEALDRRDLTAADRAVADLAAGDGLDFLAPAIAAWLDHAAGRDPAGSLARASGALAASYADPAAETITAATGDEAGAARAGIAAILTRLAGEVRALDLPIDLALLRFATRLDPAAATPAMMLAETLAGLDQLDAALDAIAPAMRAEPGGVADDVAVMLLLRADRATDAVSRATRLAARDDAGSRDHGRLADAQSAAGLHRDAADSYARALAADDAETERWQLWMARGHVLGLAGDWGASRTALEAAVAEAPREPLALNNLGYALLDRREEVPRAIRLIEQAARLAPDNAAIIDSLGWAYHLTGDRRAIPTLERAVAGRPDDPEINEHLGDAYWASGRRREARFAWTAAQVTAVDEAARRLARKIDAGPEAGRPPR